MFQDGQRLGEFEILGRIGQGGMGAVYKARPVSLRRTVAIKTLQAALAADEEYIVRFRNEAAAAALWHAPEARGGLRCGRAVKASHVAPLLPKRRRRYALPPHSAFRTPHSLRESPIHHQHAAEVADPQRMNGASLGFTSS